MQIGVSKCDVVCLSIFIIFDFPHFPISPSFSSQLMGLHLVGYPIFLKGKLRSSKVLCGLLTGLIESTDTILGVLKCFMSFLNPRLNPPPPSPNKSKICEYQAPLPHDVIFEKMSGL